MKCVNDFRLQLKNDSFIPIVVGGMGVNISSPELALAISESGGIGHISDAMNLLLADRTFGTKYSYNKSKREKEKPEGQVLGKAFDAEEIYEAQVKNVSDVMNRKKILLEALSLDSVKGAIHINVMEKLSMGDSNLTMPPRLIGALDGGIDGITLSAGLHLKSFSYIQNHSRFNEVKLGIVVSSLRALTIFLKSTKKLNRLPDYVVIEGPLAGGHLGFGYNWQESDLKQIFLEIKEFVIKENLNIALIPAGGIFTGTDAVEFLEAGANAVQVATRFVISKESGLPFNVKQAYLKSTEEDVIVSNSSPTGYPIRLLKNSPSLNPEKKVPPACEAFGYVLDQNGLCSYLSNYEKNKEDSSFDNPQMCLCHNFANHRAWTCGHYVYRLKDTTVKLADGDYYLPSAKHIFQDYLYSINHEINLPFVKNNSLLCNS